MPENFQKPPPLPAANLGREAMPWVHELERRLIAAEETIARLSQNGGALGKAQSGIASRLEVISANPIPFPYNWPRDVPQAEAISWLLTQQPPAGAEYEDPSTANGIGALGIGFVHADGMNAIAIAGGNAGPAIIEGDDSIVIGNNAEVYSDESTVVGTYSQTGGERGVTVVGSFNQAFRESAVAIGQFSEAWEDRTIAFGRNANAWGPKSIAQGEYADAKGPRSLALGADATTRAPFSMVFGAARAVKQDRAVMAVSELELTGNPYAENPFVPYSTATSIILYSDSGDGWRISVDDSGVISATLMPPETADLLWPTIPATAGEHYVWIETNNDGSLIVAVRAGYPSSSYLSRSTDGGATWGNLTAAGSRQWQRIIVSDDGTKMLAGATSGTYGSYAYTFYSSSDSGASWTSHTPPFSIGGTNYPLWSMDGSADLSIITVTMRGNVYTTSDLGANWTHAPVLFSSGSNSVVTVSSDGTVHYALSASDGELMVSVDSGVTWSLAPSMAAQLRQGIFPGFVFDGYNPIATTADGSLLVCGPQLGPLLYSEDFGQTWEEVPNSGAQEWLGVSVSDDGTWILAGTWVGGGIYAGDQFGLNYIDWTAIEYYWMPAISRDGVMMYATPISAGYGIISFDTTTL